MPARSGMGIRQLTGGDGFGDFLFLPTRGSQEQEDGRVVHPFLPRVIDKTRKVLRHCWPKSPRLMHFASAVLSES